MAARARPMKQRMILRIDVRHTARGNEVRFQTDDEHLSGCPHCLAMLSLRVAAAFHHAVEQAAEAEEPDQTDDDAGQHPFLH